MNAEAWVMIRPNPSSHPSKSWPRGLHLIDPADPSRTLCGKGRRPDWIEKDVTPDRGNGKHTVTCSRCVTAASTPSILEDTALRPGDRVAFTASVNWKTVEMQGVIQRIWGYRAVNVTILTKEGKTFVRLDRDVQLLESSPEVAS